MTFFFYFNKITHVQTNENLKKNKNFQNHSFFSSCVKSILILGLFKKEKIDCPKFVLSDFKYQIFIISHCPT